MRLVNLPDLAGDGVRHRISDLFTAGGIAIASPPLARMVLVRELSGGSANSRLGGVTVTATNGIPLNTADSLVLPSLTTGGSYSDLTWNLDELYIWAGLADTLAIAAVLV